VNDAQVSIRSATPRDGEGLRAMFARSSAETIYLRFHIPFPEVQFDRATGRFNMQWRSNRRMTPTYCRTITRAERFDPVRRMILGLDEFHGYFVVAAKEQPPAPNQPKAQLTYWFRKNDRGEESVFAAFYFLGVEMATDLEIREWQRPSDLPENSINVLEF
jgi:hypothetical protein